MDPEQRMCSELAYEGLENSGTSLQDISGSGTGVFVGISQSGWSEHR